MMLIDGGEKQTHRDFEAERLFPDETIAEALRTAGIDDAPADFGRQIRLWAVMALGLISQQERRARQYVSEGPQTARVPKETTAGRVALLDLQNALEGVNRACRGLPRAAREALRRERWPNREDMHHDLEAAARQAKAAAERLSAGSGGPRSDDAQNEAIVLLRSVCEANLGRRAPASRNGWFVDLAVKLIEPLFYPDDPDTTGLDVRIMRVIGRRT